MQVSISDMLGQTGLQQQDITELLALRSKVKPLCRGVFWGYWLKKQPFLTLRNHMAMHHQVHKGRLRDHNIEPCHCYLIAE